MKRIYVAGPDIFLADWPVISAKIVDTCNQLGFEALLPIPSNLNLDTPGISGSTLPGTAGDAQAIFESCLSMIRSCDAVIANITPFRGDEPDSGTVFEIATAYALGKPIIAYTRDSRLTYDRHLTTGVKTKSGGLLCPDGFLVENFGLPCNVMVAQACREIVFGDIFRALSELQHICQLPHSKGGTCENKPG